MKAATARYIYSMRCYVCVTCSLKNAISDPWSSTNQIVDDQIVNDRIPLLPFDAIKLSYLIAINTWSRLCGLISIPITTLGIRGRTKRVNIDRGNMGREWMIMQYDNGIAWHGVLCSTPQRKPKTPCWENFNTLFWFPYHNKRSNCDYTYL